MQLWQIQVWLWTVLLLGVYCFAVFSVILAFLGIGEPCLFVFSVTVMMRVEAGARATVVQHILFFPPHQGSA